jgi:hypothetical protein
MTRSLIIIRARTIKIHVWRHCNSASAGVHVAGHSRSRQHSSGQGTPRVAGMNRAHLSQPDVNFGVVSALCATAASTTERDAELLMSAFRLRMEVPALLGRKSLRGNVRRNG